MSESIPEVTRLPQSPSKAIKLGDGKLILMGDFNPFSLSKEERELLYELVDKMYEFEAKPSQE